MKNFILYMFATFSLVPFCYSQTFFGIDLQPTYSQFYASTQWEKIYGGRYNEVAKSVDLTLDGGYIVVGYTESGRGDITSNHGIKNDNIGYHPDYWIMKLNKDGKIDWQKTYGGPTDDKATCIRHTKDGGYIVSGFSESNGGDLSSEGAGNVVPAGCWIIKLNATGNLEWQKRYYLNEDYPIPLEATAIDEATDGYIISAIAGSNGSRNLYGGSQSYFQPSLYNLDYLKGSSSYKIVVIKIDKKGNVKWKRNYGGSGNNIAEKIKSTKDGGYIIAGATTSTDKDITENKGGADYWVVKLSSKGEIEWQKTYGSSNYEIATDIVCTHDEGYVFCGFQIDKTFVIKINNKGTLEWEKEVDNGGLTIDETSDGGYITGGLNIIKLDSNGSIQWKKSSPDIVYSVKQALDKGYIIVGSTSRNSINLKYVENSDMLKGDNFSILKLEAEKNSNFIWLNGKILSKKDKKPVKAKVTIFKSGSLNLTSDNSIEDYQTANYDAAVPYGEKYMVKVECDSFLTFIDSINLTDVRAFKELTKDIYLTPIEVGQTVLLKNVLFDVNKSDLKSESSDELDRLVDFLQTNKSVEIEIAGHTDNQGSNENNKVLSQQRVESVMAYLVSKGVEKHRLKAKGYGSSKPVTTNSTEEGRAKNRRVEFTITRQ